MDSLIFLPDTVKAASGSGASLSSPEEPEGEVEVENVERPVDLYKAIFSEDDEEQPLNGKKHEGQEKKKEAAATTLNRLIAGDFLESLGKELVLKYLLMSQQQSQWKKITSPKANPKALLRKDLD